MGRWLVHVVLPNTHYKRPKLMSSGGADFDILKTTDHELLACKRTQCRASCWNIPRLYLFNEIKAIAIWWSYLAISRHGFVRFFFFFQLQLRCINRFLRYEPWLKSFKVKRQVYSTFPLNKLYTLISNKEGNLQQNKFNL